MKQKFEIVDLDVWGNKDDGFVVNDRFKTGYFLELTERELTDDRLFIARLRSDGWLKKGVHYTSVEILGDSEHGFYINDARTGEWLFELAVH